MNDYYPDELILLIRRRKALQKAAEKAEKAEPVEEVYWDLAQHRG